MRLLFIILFQFIVVTSWALDSKKDESSAKKVRVDSVIAIVNDEIITMTDLQRSLIPLVRQLKSTYTGDELKYKIIETSKNVLQQLIENKLILQTAKNLKENEELKIPDKELKKYMQKIIDRFPSEVVFQDSLKRENLSYEDFKNDCIEQLLVKQLVAQKVSSKVFVSNNDVRGYYNFNINEYTTNSRVTFSQIWIKKESVDADNAAKKALIEKVMAQIKAGGDFKALAVQYSEGAHASEGGLWKNVEKGQFTKELEDAIWSLSPGQISPVIETRVGYHIVKVEVIEKPRQVPLKEVWEDIQNKIYFDRAEKIREEWIKKLKEEAFIEVNYASN